MFCQCIALCRRARSWHTIYGNNVAVLDIAACKVIATIATGAGPNGISFAPLAPSPAPAVAIELDVMKME